MSRPRFAIIPTNDRPCVEECLDAIVDQVDRVVVIHTGDAEKLTWHLGHGGLHTASVDGEVNISRWWNLGLELVEDELAITRTGASEWDVAIVNDDAIVPEGWFDAVSLGMRAYGAAAACSGSTVGTRFFTEPGPIAGISNPLSGFAFMLAGEKGLRANEDLHWYFSDNYIDWESRKLGGTLMMSGWPVQHLHANAQMGHDLIARVAVDAQNFVDLYGVRPW